MIKSINFLRVCVQVQCVRESGIQLPSVRWKDPPSPSAAPSHPSWRSSGSSGASTIWSVMAARRACSTAAPLVETLVFNTWETWRETARYRSEMFNRKTTKLSASEWRRMSLPDILLRRAAWMSVSLVRAPHANANELKSMSVDDFGDVTLKEDAEWCHQLQRRECCYKVCC